MSGATASTGTVTIRVVAEDDRELTEEVRVSAEGGSQSNPTARATQNGKSGQRTNDVASTLYPLPEPVPTFRPSLPGFLFTRVDLQRNCFGDEEVKLLEREVGYFLFGR